MENEVEVLVDYLKEDGGYIPSHDPDWVKIQEEVEDYNEGRVHTSYVVQNKHSNRFYAFSLESNSWDESGEDYNEYDVVEVFPTQVTVTQYLPKK